MVFPTMGKIIRWSDGFIAVDWGTTNRRGYLVDGSGQCVDEFEDDKGILSVPAGGFPAAVKEIRDRLGDKPLLLAGMIGSNRGWVEAPYVSCPAQLDDLVHGIVRPSDREALVPGIKDDTDGHADVMRGEEVQLLGALAAGLIDSDALICHPGTHNKWVIVRRGRIDGFRTVMTGELFSLLKEHSILSDLLGGEVAVGEAFCSGVRVGLSDQDLPAELFTVRARVLLGKAKREEAASFASGLLIGTDVRIGLSYPTAAQVTVMGRPELTRLYAAAIREANRPVAEIDGERCFLAGVVKIAEAMN
jgi:2-dehydro-3-deoxygalactonokinase